MTVNAKDMEELRRISTNSYDADKACMNRVLRGIAALDRQIFMLTKENKRLQEENQALRAKLTPPEAQ